MSVVAMVTARVTGKCRALVDRRFLDTHGFGAAVALSIAEAVKIARRMIVSNVDFVNIRQRSWACLEDDDPSLTGESVCQSPR